MSSPHAGPAPVLLHGPLTGLGVYSSVSGGAGVFALPLDHNTNNPAKHGGGGKSAGGTWSKTADPSRLRPLCSRLWNAALFIPTDRRSSHVSPVRSTSPSCGCADRGLGNP